ncbi:LytTR family DNA-binding domain-containing protein [Rhizobium alvei]|uniref:LytTR family DNA-binding domain-containing protein n=1 Tax=Rhizobium alvei TaxID=1132659 RepID=A0ABT8YI24_9HYPH|nr:LytTR family DNA-binding domain-containing protein [Rhizobium alvei]MDO6963239.1 LytTR family DNA-binding domain-containing protein [Rhizobium alvei]
MTYETTTVSKRSEFEQRPYADYRRFAVYFATHPVLLGMITLLSVLPATGMFAREYPGLPVWVEVVIFVVRLAGYFTAVLLLLAPWFHFCVGRGIPLFFAYLGFIFGLILLFHLILTPFTHQYMGIPVSMRIFRQLALNTATTLTLFLAIGKDVSRFLSLPGRPIPVWWPDRDPQVQDTDASAARASLSVEGEILSIQAQNQYVSIRVGDRTTLHRMTFRDALEQVAPDDGIKIHRSWWIRKSLIAGIRKDGTNFKVVGHDGLIYPLSKSLVEAVEQVLADQAAPVPLQGVAVD